MPNPSDVLWLTLLYLVEKEENVFLFSCKMYAMTNYQQQVSKLAPKPTVLSHL